MLFKRFLKALKAKVLYRTTRATSGHWVGFATAIAALLVGGLLFIPDHQYTLPLSPESKLVMTEKGQVGIGTRRPSPKIKIVRDGVPHRTGMTESFYAESDKCTFSVIRIGKAATASGFCPLTETKAVAKALVSKLKLKTPTIGWYPNEREVIVKVAGLMEPYNAY